MAQAPLSAGAARRTGESRTLRRRPLSPPKSQQTKT
jgi:hypothetical protein